MSDFVVFITIGFFSGAIPWALLIVRISRKIDVRSVGDGNPGTVNAWKSGGFIYGIVALVLEIGKTLVKHLLVPPHTNWSAEKSLNKV